MGEQTGLTFASGCHVKRVKAGNLVLWCKTVACGQFSELVLWIMENYETLNTILNEGLSNCGSTKGANELSGLSCFPELANNFRKAAWDNVAQHQVKHIGSEAMLSFVLWWPGDRHYEVVTFFASAVLS